ncbi:MAG: DUF2235 domain-containing protein [Anaerolineae bacterium]|nr:DUF2235 domain-containing protein [Anaerolineae bacterium]
MKRLVLCCDGSFQNLESYPTNVVKMAQATQHVDEAGVAQVVYYDEGVGASFFLSGVFGWGLETNVHEAYQFLCMNYAPGDEIYCFGFSRGAYTVRSLVGLIHYTGLLPRRHLQQTGTAYRLYREARKTPEAVAAFRKQYGAFSVNITLLACWDTVGRLGVPVVIPWLPFDRWANHKYRFHDTTLSPLVENALHAVAIDERHRNFALTPMERQPDCPQQRLMQVWFPGDHMSVGGGSYHRRRLADASLLWMIEKIQAWNLGLSIAFDDLAGGLDPDFTAAIPDDIPMMFEIGGRQVREVTGAFEDIHISAKQRWQQQPDYRPPNLERFRSELEQWQPMSWEG